jgi:hypothetical protein
VAWWADEHRVSFGLEPQEELPHPADAYRRPERDDEEGV